MAISVAKGIIMSKLSKRSRKPPWPGMMLPESFRPTERLSIDSTKSPRVPMMLHTNANINQAGHPIGRWGNALNKGPTKIPTATHAATPMAVPSHVLPGECFGHILCLPNREPPI